MRYRQVIFASFIHKNAKIVAVTRLARYIEPMTTDHALTVLIQTAGSQKRLAEILNTSEERVSRWVNRHHAPPELITVIAEFIEHLPRKDWPERWRQ